MSNNDFHTFRQRTLSVPTFISMLRGINVSGRNPVKMDALRKLYEALGFTEVTTYIQSGNVIFSADLSDPGELQMRIYTGIRKNFGFEVPVIVLSIDRMKRIIDKNPFSQDTNKNTAFMHVTFLSSKQGVFDQEPIKAKKRGDEAISFSDSVVYLYCPDGYGRTGLNNNFLESKLKVKATTRNWKTTLELFRLAKELNSQ